MQCVCVRGRRQRERERERERERGGGQMKSMCVDYKRYLGLSNVGCVNREVLLDCDVTLLTLGGPMLILISPFIQVKLIAYVIVDISPPAILVQH